MRLRSQGDNSKEILFVDVETFRRIAQPAWSWSKSRYAVMLSSSLNRSHDAQRRQTWLEDFQP